MTPAELARAAAGAVNPEPNAIVEHWPLDASGRVSLDSGGPLAGVDFLIKGIAISVAGKRAELGSRLAQGCVAAGDSAPMTRFREAGLVTTGRTTTPEMAFSTTTESMLHGATRNPWQPELSAGGSSGGRRGRCRPRRACERCGGVDPGTGRVQRTI